ncbi:MAG: DUF302 domain-containing protein [Thiobacillus sp.]|nr:DUF302 domain-containing protein [Thiobacillus sp.]
MSLRLALPALLLALCAAPVLATEAVPPGPRAIVSENFSHGSFADTVGALKTQLAADGWNLVAEIDLGSRLAKRNVNLPGGLVILEFTSGGATIPLLKNEATRYVAGLMPCSVSVYAMDDGRVVVSRMNAGAMAGMMEPGIGEVLKQSAARMDNSIHAALAKLAAN